jgi:hypothetical protein
MQLSISPFVLKNCATEPDIVKNIYYKLNKKVNPRCLDPRPKEDNKTLGSSPLTCGVWCVSGGMALPIEEASNDTEGLGLARKWLFLLTRNS